MLEDLGGENTSGLKVTKNIYTMTIIQRKQFLVHEPSVVEFRTLWASSSTFNKKFCLIYSSCFFFFLSTVFTFLSLPKASHWSPSPTHYSQELSPPTSHLFSIFPHQTRGSCSSCLPTLRTPSEGRVYLLHWCLWWFFDFLFLFETLSPFFFSWGGVSNCCSWLFCTD